MDRPHGSLYPDSSARSVKKLAVSYRLLPRTRISSRVCTLALRYHACSNPVNVIVSGTAPWVHRIADVKSATAINVEAERKLGQLNDEMQALVRNLKTKDQHIQESGVKIELMERRMETVKKQGEMIQDLESEIQKARKQERVYEEAMEQLQSDLDTLEQENKKLKTVVTSAERQGKRNDSPYTLHDTN